MPLYERKAFERRKAPKDLDPNEVLFYCKATHEAYRDYDYWCKLQSCPKGKLLTMVKASKKEVVALLKPFFERVILCNSLVWTCALTGKPNLTFQEAMESEAAARHSLKTFPNALKKPVLYLASLTQRTRLNDMCDDVFMYVKDRYFIGEEVEVTFNGVKKSCEITQVVLPERPIRSPVKTDNKQKKKDITPSKIKYEVVDYDTGKTAVVKAENICRPKGTYTKPRNKLFIKYHTQPKDGVWKVKESAVAKLQLNEFRFEEVFAGPPPSYATSPDKKKSSASSDKADKNSSKKTLSESSGKKTVQGKLNFKKETVEEKKKSIDKQALSEKQRLAAEKERMKIKDDQKKKLEEDKERQRQEKLKEREKKREEKKILAEYLNSWKKPRDDLECDDLKDLPAATPVECDIPQDCFGDAVMILEFLNTFGKQVQIKDAFPQGFTFEHIEKALLETDIQGVFNDLLQLFLTSIFRYQEAEEDAVPVKDEEVSGFENLDNLTVDQAMKLASSVSTWPQKYHGTALRNIPLDSFSVTEILRLHILSSGARRRVSWQGVSGPSEDPGLFFKLEETDLLKKLAKTSVFDLNCEDRCKILKLLVHQLLACDVLRCAVDENADNTRPLRHQLKQLKWAHSRKEKEETMSKKKGDGKPKEKGDGNEAEVNETPSPVDEEEKENSDNLTPEERAELEEKKAKQAAKQKAEFLRKEREIELQIRKLQSSFNITPIGKDRAFRRYWVFQSLPAVFVEDDDPFKGTCLPKPTIQAQSPNIASVRSETTSSAIKKYLQHMDVKNGSSDKENEILRDIAIVQSDLPFPFKNRKLSDLNPRVDSKKSVHDDLLEDEACLLCKNKKGEIQDNLVWYCPHSKNLLPTDQCSANIDTCPVHNINAPRTKWSFYYKEEELDALISNLNPRGFRERKLKEALINEKERIKEIMAKCPYNSLNKSLPLPPQPEVRKSQRHQNSHSSSSYAGMSPRLALDLTLRDMILELEHRIHAGGLGSLKVPDRESWRAALDKDLDIDSTKLGGEIHIKEEIEMNFSKSSSQLSEEQEIKMLAKAMRQLSQGIEPKYLHPPLGESDEYKKAKLKNPEEVDSQKKKVSALEKWQESLLQCTSTSQLFVHLGTLERSVAWSRSGLKAHCRICRRRGDGENMLLCDGCNRGHHLYCLKPPLKCIPEGDWFCLSCRPIEKPASPQKKPKRAESDSDIDSSENESEEESAEEEEEEEEDEEEDESGDDKNISETTFVQESCEACGDVGTLLCCDKCPLMYHQECVNLKRIPRGEWLCPKCSKKEEAIKKAQKHPSTGSYGTRSSTLTAETKKGQSLKTKIGKKGTKRKYEESFEEEFELPSRRSNRERKSHPEDSEKDDNPFKKVYKDSAQNAARRRSKGGSGSDMLDYKACIDLLVELMHHPSSWPFLVPVSKKDAPDYHLIIKRPMDFGTIRSKLNYMNYKNNEDFVRDIYLVLQNCEWFNPKCSPEYKAAQVLYKEVKRLLQEYQICNPFSTKDHFLNVNES